MTGLGAVGDGLAGDCAIAIAGNAKPAEPIKTAMLRIKINHSWLLAPRSKPAEGPTFYSRTSRFIFQTTAFPAVVPSFSFIGHDGPQKGSEALWIGSQSLPRRQPRNPARHVFSEPRIFLAIGSGEPPFFTGTHKNLSRPAESL